MQWLERHGEESESLLAAVYSLGRSFRTQLAHYLPDPVVRLSRDVMYMRKVGWHELPSHDMQLLHIGRSWVFCAAALLCKATKPSAGRG